MQVAVHVVQVVVQVVQVGDGLMESEGKKTEKKKKPQLSSKVISKPSKSKMQI